MKENTKVYVKVTYLGDKLDSISIMHNLVMFNLLNDSSYYQRDNNSYDCQTLNDKFIVEVKNTKVTHELFICNFNEIINYLH